MAQYPPLILDAGHVRQFAVGDQLAGTPCARIGHFVCPGILGLYSVVGLGFKPKMVTFWVSKGQEVDKQYFCCCQGMMDANGNQNAMSWAGGGGKIAGSTNLNKCMDAINQAGISQVTAEYVSMDDDGFTINFTVVNALFVIRWKAVG